VAVGAVAPVPLRLPGVETALVGGPATSDAFASAAELAREGTAPLPMTGYKVDLLVATVLETLERAQHGTPVTAARAPIEAKAPEADPEAPTASPP
jgi:CO/xanthine dehydrogenase FAD-binding subunit